MAPDRRPAPASAAVARRRPRPFLAGLGACLGVWLAIATPARAAPPPRTPKRIFLWYADGGKPPVSGAPCGHATPPRYSCTFGTSPRDCARQVQVYLDRWYADFDVTFTYLKPTRGRFYTVVITSAGTAWCGAGHPAGVGGVAPISDDCRDLASGVAYAFACGTNAKSCATVIAQEQAHLVGLQHTQSAADVMCPIAVPEVAGFEDREQPLVSNRMPPPCPGSQNSYRLMLQRLGPRRRAK